MNLSKLILRLYVNEPKSFLSVHDKRYQRAVCTVLDEQLLSDDSNNDVTSQVVFLEDFDKTAIVVAKQNGVISGVDEVVFWLSEKKIFKIRAFVKNGDSVKKGSTILEISGSVKKLLAFERTILNIIGHMSGISSHANSLLSIVNKSRSAAFPMLAATRKTRFGLLDKAAVIAGGCGAHRLNLSDCVLIKHNHLYAQSGGFSQILVRAYNEAVSLKRLNIGKNKFLSTQPTPRFFEVEVTHEKDFFDACEFFNCNAVKELPTVIMLDNFSAKAAARIIKKMNLKYPDRNFIVECSGGISSKNLIKYTKSGADVLSMGSLVYGASFLDVSMRLMNS